MPKRSRRAAPSVLSAKQYRQTGSEHSLQVSVLEYLALNAKPHAFWFAIPNAGKRSWRVAARMKAEGMQAGVSDLCIMLPGGGVLWLELKIGNEKQSDEQLVFERVCQILDHPYRVIRTLDEAISFLRYHGALKETA